MARDRRTVTEATIVAAMFSGAPSTAHALLTSRSLRATGAYVYEATRAAGTLIPPGRPGLVRGTIVHLAMSTMVGEALSRALPSHRSAAWGATAGLALGVVDVGIIGRRFPALFALVADRER
jgi:hypothetical protein